MSKIKINQPKQTKSDIELFAKAYFNINLTKAQLEIIDSLSKGRYNVKGARKMPLMTVNRVVKAYLTEGLIVGGRVNMPVHPKRPESPPKNKAVSQEGKILELIKRPGGAYNYELSRHALKYTSVISELRKDGHFIVADRQYLRGRPSNTYRYRLIEV